MNDEMIVNTNLNKFTCVLLKLVSGEEIITHVNMKEMQNKLKDEIVLYDPYKVAMDGPKVIFANWIVCDEDNSAFIISKKDIMVNTIPSVKYKQFYDDIIDEKYSTNNEEDEILYSLDGNDSIH